MNPNDYTNQEIGKQWQPQPVTLQAQHYASQGSRPPPAWNAGWHPQHYQQSHWISPQHAAGGYLAHPRPRPPPPPQPPGVVHGNHVFQQPYQQQPGGVGRYHGNTASNTQGRIFPNYLSPRPPRGMQKRKRKKDIVPPVEKMTQDAVVRLPADESERLEIEAWKAERRKHWPSAANIQRKESDAANDTREITLVDVLDTQKRLGLTRKAGTEDLVKQHLQHRHKHAEQHKPVVKREPVLAKGPHKKRTSLLERLLEKDMKTYKAKIIQICHFVHMNDFFRDLDTPLVFPEGTKSDKSEQPQSLKQPVVPYGDSSDESSGSDATTSGG